MTTIRLHPPVPMSPRLARLRLFPGRHLGEDELDRLQAYAEERLAPLLATAGPGIVRGLELDLPAGGPDSEGVPGEGVAVGPGLAVTGDGRLTGLFYAIRATWRFLVEAWLRESRATDAAGVYYLVLRRSTGIVDADIGIDPCRRTEADPRRDTRLETLGGLALRSLALSPEAIAALTPSQIRNRVAALNADGAFLPGLGQAVPLALLAISRREPPPEDAEAFAYRVDWVSQAAGRYRSVPDSGYQVLLAQVQEAFRDALAEAEAMAEQPGAPVSLAERLEQTLRLDYLPAAGVLPSILLRDPDGRRPSLPWLPAHLGINMVPVPEESVPELIERHLPRRPIALASAAGERLRLLLAVNEPDYRPDLLDFPETDARLAADLHRYHTRGYQAWLDWRLEHDRLYGLLGTELLTADEVRALALPQPVAEPERPGAFYGRLIAQAPQMPAEQGGGTAYPYDGGPPSPPQSYLDWLVPDPSDPNGPRVPPPVPTPSQDGLVIRYRVAQLDLERLDNRVRTLRGRVEKTRDYLLLQRQQLDAQTVSLAALGGGVAGDGAGLQVARWLPFTQLKEAAGTAPSGAQPPSGGVPSEVSAANAPTPPILSASALLSATSMPTFHLAMAQPVASLSTPVATAFAAPAATAFAVPSKLPLVSSLSVAAATTGLKGISASSTGAVARASIAELSLDRDRLDRLKAAPKQAVSEPAFKSRAYQFGVLDHIQAEVREYEAAYRGMRDLIATLDSLFDRAEAEALRTALEGFGVPLSPAVLAQELQERPYPLGLSEVGRMRAFRDRLTAGSEARAQVQTLIDGYSQLLGTLGVAEGTLEESGATDTKRRYEALFRAGQILTRQIAYMEDRYNRLEEELEGRLRERIRLEALLAKLAAQIEEAARRLAGLDARRIERLGDYGVAQGLVREDFERVYRANLERSRVLTTGLKGLYYVRVREAPVSAGLADPLPLRFASPGDPVPGCDWGTEVDVPATLAEFFAAVLEVPMADWRTLAPLAPRLPVPRVPDLLGLRRYRFGQRVGQIASGLSGPRAASAGAVLAGRLAPVALATQAVYRGWAVFEPATSLGSRAAYLAEAARLLSLADLRSGTDGALRREADTLHDRLEQCVVCIMDRLAGVAPSLRFEWSQLAEDDRLDAERPETWPGLERAEAADFNALRTLVELLAWWFRQLGDGASAGARAALRNLIRAAVIVSAHGDPDEILRGQVTLPPRRLAVGESLRLALEKTPIPGTRLQILDEAQRVVGLLAVQDQDDRGTLAQVVRVDDIRAQVTTRFSVVSTRPVQRLF
jgi:hypothetical protein